MPVLSFPHSGVPQPSGGTSYSYTQRVQDWSGLPADVTVKQCYWTFDIERQNGNVTARWYEYGNASNYGMSGVNTTGTQFVVTNVTGTSGTARIYCGAKNGWAKYNNLTFHIEYAYKQSSMTLSASTVEAGNAITANISAKSSTATHTLTWKLGSNTPVTQTLAAGVHSSNFTVPLSWLPNATSGTATCTLTTLEGGSQVGETQTLSFTVTVNAGVTPSCTVSAALVNGFAGLYLGGRSSVKLTIGNTQAGSGASLKSYKISGSGYSSTAQTATFGPLNAGTHTFTATVTDSRGRTGSATVSVTVQAYASPTLSGVSIYRSNSGGTASETGGYIALRATAAHTALDGANTVTMQGRYRPVNGAWSAWTAMTSGTRLLLGGGALSSTSSYEAQIQATDTVGNTASYAAIIPTASVTFNLKAGGNGAAFGKYAETEKALELAAGWKLMFGSTPFGGSYGELLNIPGGIVRSQYLAGAATYANGATIQLPHDPTKYTFLLVRLDWGGVAVAAVAGNVGSRGFTLMAASRVSNIKLNTVVLRETDDPTMWTVESMARILGDSSGITYSTLGSLNIGPIWGLEVMAGSGGGSDNSGNVEPTNQVPISIDTDGSVYNGKGYMEGYRLSSSGNLSAQTNSVATGFMAAKPGDVFRMKGTTWSNPVGYNYYVMYDASFKKVAHINIDSSGVLSNGWSYGANVDTSNTTVTTDGNNVTTFAVAASVDYAYVRISATGAGANMFITKNEEMA